MSHPSDEDDRPLSETIQIGVSVPPPREGSVVETADLQDPFSEDSVIYTPARLDSLTSTPPMHPVAPGESLQLVRYSRRGTTLMITGLTPHGRRLTFEQREDRDGWYVVVAGRRRRPTQRELGLVVATIAQEVEAAMAPEGEREEVRSAYRLAATSDQPGIEIRGLQAYRDLLLDEAAAYLGGALERLAVVAVEYQAFKRFALRHGHRIGAAFVRALGERLHQLFQDEPRVHICHKHGKSFRVIVGDRGAAEVQALVSQIASDGTREWLVQRVWGVDNRTHPDEVNFYIGIAFAGSRDRGDADYATVAQQLNDDAYRAAKLGQLRDHTSVQIAKTTYQTSIYMWRRGSHDDLEELANRMDDGPAEVMAEMQDYLHELVPADLEGMAVEGDVHALIYKAIARDGFWQGTIAMRIAGEQLLGRFLHHQPSPEGQNDYVGGFDLGDEFYGIALEADRLYFAWGDLNSAGVTRLRAGLHEIQRAVGWRREDNGGIVGYFLRAVADRSEVPLLERVRAEAQQAYEELHRDEVLRVNDTVDIANYLWAESRELVSNDDLVEGASFRLVLPEREHHVYVRERRSRFIARLEIDGEEHAASIAESFVGPSIKLRVRDAVISAAICMLQIRAEELEDMLGIVREDNHLPEDAPMDVVGFLRHIADILLADQVKGPGKIRLALGDRYDARQFVQAYSLEDVREHHPGLFYEAVHHNLLTAVPHGIDRNLAELIVNTMLARTRPSP